jgi:hypothetical protein
MLQDAQLDETIVRSYGHIGPERSIAELLTIVKLAGGVEHSSALTEPGRIADMNPISSVGHAYFRPVARYAFDREGVFR